MEKTNAYIMIILTCFFLSTIANLPVAHAVKNDSTQLKITIADIKVEVDNNTNDIVTFKRIARYLIAVIVLVGLSGWWAIGVYVRRKVTTAIDKTVYKVDPTYLEVKIPSTGFDHEAKKLKLLGFENLKKYSWLDDSCTSGCVIYKVDNNEQALVLQKFIKNERPDENKVGYILYVRKQIDHTLFEEFCNVTFANSPLTLINAVYAVARGIVK